MKTKQEVLDFLAKYSIRSHECSLQMQRFIEKKFPDEENYDDFLYKVAPDDPSAISCVTFEYWFEEGIMKKATFKNKEFIYKPAFGSDNELAYRYALDMSNNQFFVGDFNGSSKLFKDRKKGVTITTIDAINYEKILEHLINLEEF